MKKELPLTYQDHLNFLTKDPQESAWDYSMYIKESQVFQSFSEVSSTVIFFLDYATKTYPLLGSGVKQVMSHPKEAFLEGGLEFMLHNHLDFEILNKEMFPDQVNTIKLHESANLSHLRFSRSYRFKKLDGSINTVLQRHNMISARNANLPIAIFGCAWDITNFSEKGKVIHQIESYNSTTQDWTLLLSKEYYPDIDPNQLLSKREVEILKWSVEGLGSKQIAAKLFITFNTVNTHRRNMLRKTNCQNSMELLRYAIENKLL